MKTLIKQYRHMSERMSIVTLSIESNRALPTRQYVQVDSLSGKLQSHRRQCSL